MADGDAALLAPSIWEAVHPFTVDDYHRIAEAGILSADDRTELIEGVVVNLPSINAPHFAAVLRLHELLCDAVGERALVSVRGPVGLPPRSEPQPSLALLRPPINRYEAVLPGSADVFLLVEVSDATLARDRDVKVPLYARHGAPEYWLFDLSAREVVTYRGPMPDEGRYNQVERAGVDAVLAVEALPGVAIAVADVFSRSTADQETGTAT